MAWLEIIRTIWPIAVVLLPLVTGAGFLWLRTQFPTKTDLKLAIEGAERRHDERRDRLEEGSRKLADLDKRVALVEQDCEAGPTKGDLNNNHTVLAARMSGVESSLRGLEKQLSTQNDYVHALLTKGLNG